MKLGISLLFIGSLVVAACGDDPNALTGGRAGGPGADGEEGTGGAGAVPVELQCTEKPRGRSYVLFDGTKLEESRTNENVGVNRARLKPYGVMAGEYQRALGAVPPSLAAASGSFDTPPDRWFAEAQYSGVSLNAVFDISFEGCRAYTNAAADFAQAPTPETATTQCTSLMRKAWSRTPSPAEIGACVDLATTKLQTEADARKKWTYVCASILSSSQFLTF